jgi:hypothetical protein
MTSAQLELAIQLAQCPKWFWIDGIAIASGLSGGRLGRVGGDVKTLGVLHVPDLSDFATVGALVRLAAEEWMAKNDASCPRVFHSDEWAPDGTHREPKWIMSMLNGLDEITGKVKDFTVVDTDPGIVAAKALLGAWK